MQVLNVFVNLLVNFGLVWLAIHILDLGLTLCANWLWQSYRAHKQPYRNEDDRLKDAPQIPYAAFLHWDPARNLYTVWLRRQAWATWAAYVGVELARFVLGIIPESIVIAYIGARWGWPAAELALGYGLGLLLVVRIVWAFIPERKEVAEFFANAEYLEGVLWRRV